MDVWSDAGTSVALIASFQTGALVFPGVGTLGVGLGGAVVSPAAIVGSDRRVTVRFPVPGDASLVGATIYFQAIRADWSKPYPDTLRLSNTLPDSIIR